MKYISLVTLLLMILSSGGNAQRILTGTPKVSLEKSVLDFGKVILKH